jgi:S-adenosylmethionine/arginine decarboxylase-like enzyme
MYDPQPIEICLPATGPEILQAAAAQQVWGIASSIDIYQCDPRKIRDAEIIRAFVAELCQLIEMKRFGETQVVHFGEDERVAGFSMVQLIETSLISAHFANLTNTVYLDVFSCKPYDPEIVQSFAQSYFGGRHSNLNVTLRK